MRWLPRTRRSPFEEPCLLVRGWNKLAAKAYYLAGGGPCIAIDAGPSSPRVGNTARSVGRPYWGPERRSVPPAGGGLGRPAGPGGEPTGGVAGAVGGGGENFGA